MSIQTTISFNIRKKCSFYGTHKNNERQDYTNATTRKTTNVYTPTVKKVYTLSSSDSDSDSDVENLLKECDGQISTKKNTPVKSPRRTSKYTKPELENCSPPKQKKIVHSSEAISSSPTTLLNRLNLESLNEKDERLIPKRLFRSNKYREARKALHSSAPTSLPGREKELHSLQLFISECVEEEKSASLYVSGPPGTGKTACLCKIIEQAEFKSKLQVVYINCTTMKSAATIYAKIVQELGLTVTKCGRNSKMVIEKYLVSRHKMLLLILDEIDQLESKKQTVLYSIFEWPSKPNSKLILVGIANALDLTDRILPRLQARCELKPKLMHFASYTKQQIINIISMRLLEANVPDVFTASAIQLLAGKLAAVSGDIRRALDMSRRVIELAESQKSLQILQPTNNNGTNTDDLSKHLNISEKPVDCKEVMTTLGEVYGGLQNLDKQESTFPLQQKLLLCSLMLILKKGRNKDVTIGKLHGVYTKVCKKRNIHCVDISEFVSLCTLIETRGVLCIIRKKESRLSKISLQWDQEELDAALQDKNMLAEIISDVTCL